MSREAETPVSVGIIKRCIWYFVLPRIVLRVFVFFRGFWTKVATASTSPPQVVVDLTDMQSLHFAQGLLPLEPAVRFVLGTKHDRKQARCARRGDSAGTKTEKPASRERTLVCARAKKEEEEEEEESKTLKFNVGNLHVFFPRCI